jgi:FkbM family methyltransferase
LVNLGFNIDREQFQDLATKYLYAPDMRRGLEFLASRGLNPKNILDIGAFEGNWAKMAMSVWPTANLILVEANPAKASLLRRKSELANVKVIEGLLGPDEKTVSFHLMESGSSVFQENSPLERQSIHVQQKTLDSLELDADFIKIDVQGYELEVLRGGMKSLAKAEAVLIELSLIEINSGCPLLHEALAFMKGTGFVTNDVLEVHRRPLDGAMNQLDILFLREGSPLRADRRHWA